jgi:drug/metabolite transporter (DMT)-like permease
MSPDSSSGTALSRRAQPAAPPLPRLGWFLLAMVTVTWGFNWTSLKVGLQEIPIWQFRSATCLVAGAALLLIAVLSGQRIAVPQPLWRPLVAGALLNITGWNMLAGFGVRVIPSGEAALLAYTMPIWATAFGIVLLGERFTWRIGAALLLGLCGVGILISNGFTGMGSSPAGIAAMLGAAFSWAIGTVMQKRIVWPVPVMVAAGWQLVIGAVPMILMATTEPFVIPHATPIALAALCYSCLFGMTLGYYAWFKIVSIFPAGIAAIGTVAVPVVGALSGVLLLGEPYGWRQLAALLAVTVSLSLVVTGGAPSRRIR